MSQIIAMANQLQEAEKTIHKLTRALDAQSSLVVQQTTLTSQGGAPAALESTWEPRGSATRPPDETVPAEPTSEELLSNLSLDGHGKVCGAVVLCPIARHSAHWQ